MNESAIKPGRGSLLAVWLAFMALANAWTVYRYYTIIDDFVRHHDPRFTDTLQWALPLLAILAALNIVAVVLLWFWRKIGFYIFVLTSFVSLVINLTLKVPLGSLLLGLIGLIVLWALLKSRWSDFR